MRGWAGFRSPETAIANHNLRRLCQSGEQDLVTIWLILASRECVLSS